VNARNNGKRHSWYGKASLSLAFCFMTCVYFVLHLSGTSAEPPLPIAQTFSVREAVYFGPAGPVRIRFHISIDGRPADAVWNDAINSLFTFCDRDGDGSLNMAERGPFVTPTRAGRDIQFDGIQAVQPLRLTFGQKEEKISRAAFADAVRTAGYAGIGLRVIPSRVDSRQLSSALFHYLDQDGDGRLSPNELKAARERLETLDVDEDEFITAAELLGRGVGVNASVPRPIALGSRPNEEPTDSSTDMIFLTADGVQAVKQLLTARGKARATSLRPAEFGADAKKFASLDQDGNGVLDTTELTAWLRQPPELELSLVFDSAACRLTVLTPTTLAPDANGALLAILPGGRFQFDSPIAANSKEWEQAADQVRKQFKELGKEKGFVERKQLENQPTILSFFDLADRKGQGKVTLAEVEAALKILAPLARCRVNIAFADQGNGLFELLDTNGDGRLSQRELVEATAVLRPFAGVDGLTGPKDLVRRFHVKCGVDRIPVGVLLTANQRMQTVGSNRTMNLPAWFTKMDRNGDGEVSQREFLGPIEMFRKLDRNGDGLISPDEAVAAQK
jgi:Ca2+-binding EF-hand superfamily protein